MKLRTRILSVLLSAAMLLPVIPGCSSTVKAAEAEDSQSTMELTKSVQEDVTASEESLINENPETFCNPINLSYCLQYGIQGSVGVRMLADPQPIFYKGEYWLFVTNAYGYYHSKDLVNWEFVFSKTQQINNYAPGVFEHDGYLYISRHSNGNLYRTNKPETGTDWEYVRGNAAHDPYYFKDPDTGRIFMLQGCVGINKPTAPIKILELDTNSPTLMPLPVDFSRENATDNGYEPFKMQRDQHGYEVPGQYNDDYRASTKSWLEGAGMIKHNGKYYVYYSGPATECASYNDGCYVSDDPLGPYEWCSSSPFAYKVTGYTVGAGHGHDVVEQKSGDIWKFGSVSIAGHHLWERRISLYPVSFDQYDRIVTDLSVSDYPMWLPGSKKSSFESQGPDWNLLSYGMKTTVSSTLNKEVKSSNGISFKIDPKCASDENIRTWWSAETGKAGEWIEGDLGEICTVNALQLNFMDEGIYPDAASFPGLSGLDTIREYTGCYRYLLEYSVDGKNWSTLTDKSDYSVEPFSGKDYSHDYYELKKGTKMRYVRVTNKGDVPAGGKFAISGLRIFGQKDGTAPGKVEDFTLSRINGADERSVSVSWKPVEGAEGYIIRYGTYEDSMNLHHQVINNTAARINSLTTYEDYYFRIDTYNKSGRTIGDVVKMIPGKHADVVYPDKITVKTGVGLIPELPKTIEAKVDGKTKVFEVSWDEISLDKLKNPGIIKVKGTVKSTGAEIEATVNIYEVLGAENISLACAMNQMPELPKAVTVYYKNEEKAQYNVTWDAIPQDSMKKAGIVEVNGKAGEYSVKASIRVAETKADQYNTPAGKNLALNVNGKKNSLSWPRTFGFYSNANEEAHNATDGIKNFETGAGKNIWSDYQAGQYHTNTNAGYNDADRLPFVATVFGKEGSQEDNDQMKYTVQSASVGFIEEDGNSAHKIALPADYKIEYYSANNGVIPVDRVRNSSAKECSNTKGWKEDNPIKKYDGWTEVTYIGGKPSVPELADAKKMIDVEFEPVETTAIRITLTPQKEKWTGLEEFEVYYIKIQEHEDFEVKAINVDGTNVLAQFDKEKKTLTLDQKEGMVTAEATNNAAVTVLKSTDGQVKVMFLPENGDSGKAETYTLNFKNTIKLPYVDVKESDWFYEAVLYNYKENLMTGLDETHFGPYESLSRAQFALILYRMEGKPEVDTKKSFLDITGDEWYGPAVLWAAESGIVAGYLDGNFGPADMITREQMALMMYRYADYLKEDTSASEDLGRFKDASSVSTFAADAMKWAFANKIITGKDNGTILDPQGNTARAEAAAIIQRFMEK